MNKFLPVFLCLLLCGRSWAQLSDGSAPYSFGITVPLPAPTTLKVERPEAEIRAVRESGSFDKTYDFGVAVAVDDDLLLRGASVSLPGGMRLVRQTVSAPGAYGINLNFKHFNPGRSGRLWIYSEDGTSTAGAFDTRSATPGIPFATAPVRGESVVLEFLYDPSEAGIAVELAEVVYEFADVFGMAKAFGGSGACNRNVNCPEYAGYADPKRSVAMILTANNVRWCSGAMVNNTAQDGRPYFLTARHCNTTPNSIFMFNYESPDCSNIDGPTGQSIQGCTVRVDWYVSDVTLVELSSPPPAQFFSYFSGWDAVPQPADSVYGIHHPKGDIKKISFDRHAVTASPYGTGDTSLAHWKVSAWDVGTTEQGSSGSPLFNHQNRIVGQLHGGQASCANSVNDYYGRFSYSWWGENTPQTALKFWLDPDGTGATHLDGADFNAPAFDRDLALTGLSGPDSVYCLQTADWVATVRNNGTLTVPGFRVRLLRNGTETAVREVNQALSYGGSVPVSFTGIPVEEGAQVFEAVVEFLTPPADENTGNNSVTRNIQRIAGDRVTVTFTYDLFSTETKWGIYETDGTPVYESGNAAAHETVVRSFCLPQGCYLFRVTDSGGDGICCTGGEGSFTVTGSQGTVLVANKAFTQAYDAKFCAPGLPPDWEPLFQIFPNPAVSQINVKVQGYAEGTDGEIVIFTVDGKVLTHRKGTLKYLNTFDVSEWARGVYFVRVSVGKLKSVQKFIKN